MLRLGLVQTCSTIDATRNVQALEAAIRQLAAAGAGIVFLPEMCGRLDRNAARLRAASRPEADDPVLAHLRALARDLRTAIAIGSLAIRDPADSGRLRNRSIVVDEAGEIIARYDKIHLFDVDLPNGDRYRESATFAAGRDLVTATVAGVPIGLAICYDLRFPSQHQALARQGARILAQPSSFTVPTGRAHWHVLLRARAIETGSFVVAAAQSGTHEDGRQTYGHSLVVDPWGRVLLDMGEEVGVATIDIDPGEADDARARIPALAAAPVAAPVAGAPVAAVPA